MCLTLLCQMLPAALGQLSLPRLVLFMALVTCLSWKCVSTWTSEAICGTDVSWTYEPVSGKCWMLPSNSIANTTQLITKSSAIQKCASVLGGLPDLTTTVGMFGLQRFLTANGLAADVWTSVALTTVDNSTNYYYPDYNRTVTFSHWLEGEAPTTVGSLSADCVVFSSRVETLVDASGWTRKIGFKPTSCSSIQATVCYKNVTHCSGNDLPQQVTPTNMTAVNSSYGIIITNVFHVGLRLNVQCSQGFYRQRDVPGVVMATPPVTTDGLAVNQIECLPVSDPDKPPPTMKSSVIEECQKTACPTANLKKGGSIPNVESYDQYLTKDYYLYGESFPLNCSQGYVSYVNQSSVYSLLTCSYRGDDKTRYEWVPPDLNTCQPVTCPPVQTVIRNYMTAYKAVNRVHAKEYNEFQQWSYPFYPNRVYIKCMETGTFFEDRMFTKVVSCDLKNGSLTEGSWYGVLGTSLSRLSTTQCVPVSCQSDELIEKSSSGRDLLGSLGYSSTTAVEFQNGTKLSIETKSFNLVELYTFGTTVQFSCQPGFSTGVGQPIVLCTDTGSWNVSRLPSCTKTSETVIPKGKHYVPPSVEAQGADSIGAIAIIVCILFGVFMVILDLSTLSRDLVLIRRNIDRLKRRICYTKRAKSGRAGLPDSVTFGDA